MSTWGNTISSASEAIQLGVRNTSIMRGKDRTLLKSPLHARRLGLFNFQAYSYYTINPFPPVPLHPTGGQLATAQAYFKDAYVGQTNYHLEIDPILMTIPIIQTGSFVSFGNTFATYSITNAQFVQMFQTNANLPPNKNVYFIIKIKTIATPPISSSTKQGSFDSSVTFGVSTAAPPMYVPKAMVMRYSRSVFQTILAPFPNSISIADIAFIRRTDANGKIPNMDELIRINPGNNVVPFFDRYNLALDYNLTTPGAGAIKPDTGLVIEVREIKDRYDVGDANDPFHTRRYQELTDNEWDTKVATDA